MSASFFVDENDLALAKALEREWNGVVYPGHADLPEVPRQTLDDDWLPFIGARGLVVITRDKRIRYRPVEKKAWLNHGVRGFVLTGRTSQSTKDSLSVLRTNQTRIEKIVHGAPSGPWMFAVTSSGLREIELR